MKLLSFKKTHIALAVVATFSSIAAIDSQVAEASWERSSTVTDTVTFNAVDGTWDYVFTVNNTSTYTNDGIGGSTFSGVPLVIDWELPYFADMGLANIVSPDGWGFAIETIGTANPLTGWEGDAAWQDPLDPFYAGADSPYTTGTQVVHWYCENIEFGTGGEGFCSNATGFGEAISAPGSDAAEYLDAPTSLTGFGFTASFGPTSAPYQASWAETPVITGDPSFPLASGVGSPLALGTPSTSVPEASSLALFALSSFGLFGLSAARKRKQK